MTWEEILAYALFTTINPKFKLQMKTSTEITKSTKLKSIFLMAILVATSISCTDDDDPIAVDEEETITTMNVTLSTAGSADIVLQSRDLDGDGPEPPVISVANLAANTTYAGSIELLNETADPAEDITVEVAEEDDEHQFFFSTGGAISQVTYDDEDGDGNPIGLSFVLTTGDAGSGTLQITLRHEPKKPNDGSLADAGGETDIAQTFTVTVE